MRNLSDTIARLSAYRKLSGGLDSHLQHKSPGRLVHMAEFGSNPGNLSAKTYCPASLPQSAPLVVVLHGCTQDAGGYDYGAGWSQLADRHGFGLLFPEQKRENNPNLCFNWFVPGDIARGSGEALSIRQMVDAACDAMGSDQSRIYVTGLSAGGAMTSVMLAAYPEVFAGGGIIAGLPYGCASSVPEAFDRMRGHAMPSPGRLQAILRAASDQQGHRPKLSIWHGLADQTVLPVNASSIVDQWRVAHQLVQPPIRRDKGNGLVRDVHLSADGTEQIEVHLIPGMAHGTPLATASGIGNAGPFMLDVGISSTLHMAQFWGIAPVSEAALNISASSPANDTGALSGDILPPVAHSTTGRLQDSAQPIEPHGIKSIIEDALRRAGLMR
jgi:poly(hydroxyalkanoate) depolymerase family esterase